MRTNRTEVHEGGEGDDPEVLGVDYVAAIELGEAMLDNWVSVRVRLPWVVSHTNSKGST